MTYDEIEEKVGEPSVPGVNMPRYELADCGQVVLRLAGEQLAGISVQREDGRRVDFFTGKLLPIPDLEDFAILERRMLFSEVTSRVGEPNSLGGSGLFGAIYELSDRRTLFIQLATRWTGKSVEYVVVDAWIGSGEGGAINFFDQ